MRRVILTVVTLLALGILVLFGWQWKKYANPLESVGVTYQITNEGAGSKIRFFMDRHGRKAEGPEVTGEKLFVRYRVRDYSTPDIVVRSGAREGYVLIQVNTKEADKPPFSVLHQDLPVEYAPAAGSATQKAAE